MVRRLNLRRGPRIALVLAVAGSISFGAWTAAAQVVTPTTPDPLPGSQFQGGDGNQGDAPGLIDWQGLQADGRVERTSDPQANDNIFAGGTKELEPGGWALTTTVGGAAPPKDNILDIYRAVDHPPGGDTFLYLAFTREAGNGTTFLTFELNQDTRLWTNSAGDRLPCRTTGDILITFDEQGNGVQVEVDRWVTETSLSNGCANTGRLVAATNLTPNVDVQGSFNSAGPITNYLPGFFGATIPTDQFGETAINLTTVLGGLGERCAVFGSTWAHSRASTSESAELKDYVAPQPFHARTCKASPTLTSSASGIVNSKAHGRQRLRRHLRLTRSLSINDTATLSGGADPTGAITFKLFDNSDCSGTPIFTDVHTATGEGSYQSGSYLVTAPGTYRWVVDYTGDDNNNAAGPTSCGAGTETVTISKATPMLTTRLPGPVRSRRVAFGPRRRRRFRTVSVHTGRAAQPIHDTATLSGGLAPTGSITFLLYGPGNTTCQGNPVPVFTSTVPVNGDGTYPSDPYTPTTAGTYRWVASYSGDSFNDKAGPTGCDAEIVEISKAQPQITTEASGATELGSPISDSATLTDGSDPTGTITFRVYGPDNPTCTGSPADTSKPPTPVSGNGTYPSQAFTPTATGTYRWVATYSGDANNKPVGTSCSDSAEAQVVAHPSVQPTLTSRAVAGSALAPAGSPIRDTATLSGGSSPTGTITFDVYGPNDSSCAGPAIDASTATVSGNGNYNSTTFTPTEAGTYHWIAHYLGDDTNKPAGPTACADKLETIVVSKARPTFSTAAIASVTLPGYTQDAATISGANPGGTIQFNLFGPGSVSCSGTPAFTAPPMNVVGSGTYHSPTFYPTAPGTYHWLATYSGDANNNSAANVCGDHGETTVVSPSQPSLTTSASPPAHLRKGRRVRAAGLSIYDSATLTGFQPTGQITFDLYGPNDDTCSGTRIFTTATIVSGNGTYNSDSFTPSASGTYRWRATYSGDTNNSAAGPTGCGDSNERVQVTVPSDASLITSASDAVVLGGAVHDTATLTGGSSPTGTITFRLYAPSDSTCTSHVVFTSTVAVNGNGDYTSESSVPTEPGAYHWVASYSGDAANHAAATSCGDPGETVVVRPHDISPVTPAVSTAASTMPALGGTIYDSAHLSGGIDPGGAITFKLFGPDDTSCSRPPVFTAVTAVDGNGNYRSATFVVTVGGTYRWVARYGGDALDTSVATACGDPAETTTVNSIHPAPEPPVGPNVPTPRTPKPKPEPKPPHRVKPPFTG